MVACETGSQSPIALKTSSGAKLTACRRPILLLAAGRFFAGRWLGAFSERAQDAVAGDVERAVEGASAGVTVAASAKAFGDGRYIDCALAAQREPDAMISQLAHEDGHIDPGDSDGVVDEAFAVFLGCGREKDVLIGDPHPGNAALAA